MDEDDWAAAVEHAEREGEVLGAFLAEACTWATDWRGTDAPPVRRIVDIGCGPGVGTCALAVRYPEAQVLAVDGSPAMLARTAARAQALGLADRVHTGLAELPDGLEVLDRFGAVDLVWASMSLHHIADRAVVLRALGARLAPRGVLIIAEVADPLRVLPRPLDLATPGFEDRLVAAGAAWFARLEAGLSGGHPIAAIPDTVAAAGLTCIGERIARVRLDAPLPAAALAMAIAHVQRSRHQLREHLDATDLDVLDLLGNVSDPRGADVRDRLVIDASRRLVLATR